MGWIYEYALVDKSGAHNLAQLRSLQDWFLKPELQSVQGVSEIATVGGMVQTYQVIVDPLKISQYQLTLQQVLAAIRSANNQVGGSVVEMAEAEYMVRGGDYLTEIEHFEKIALPVRNANGVSLFLKDVASIRLGPQSRRGVAELDGEGEVVGGIVVMRYNENALQTISNVKAKLNTLKRGLPDGVEIVETYDRSSLIERSVESLQSKLMEEIAVVVLVCFLFLLHARSTLVAVVTLPLSVLLAFIIMRWLDVNANIMSLGGIAIAIGALVDAAIVMVENVHKHLERFSVEHEKSPSSRQHWKIIESASKEVAPALFFSLLIITLSFLPVFSLEAQEGKLFSPLALTKTFAMAAAALLAITLVPVLMGMLIKGKVPTEKK